MSATATSLDALVPLGGLEFETASEHVCHDVPIFGPEARAGEMRRALEARRFEMASHVAVCTDRKLLGMIRVEDLLPAAPETSAHELMDPDPPVVAPGLDQERAAWHAVKHGESALAVLDAEGRFDGLVPPQRLLAVLLWEHDEDLSRLAGVLHRQTAAHAAQDETTLRRLGHRLPWLLVGLAGAIAAAHIVEGFGAQLTRSLLLTMFLPGVVYIADAVGTQTETLVVRGLSLGLDLPRMLRKEVVTGLGIGVILAVVFFAFATWRWGDARTIGVVAVALFAASAVASVVALLLPWALDQLGLDPAFGSGPLATAIQDLLSIVIYLVIALEVLG